ncbi:zinc ribbon domain-containing protein [Arthrobacter sp. CAU 1506]|nr:zinc ribbon domain-containing protein [Arthrobacter sp. CAU 1506]
MTLYAYACPVCEAVEMNYPIGQAPQEAPCSSCGRLMRRVFSPPRLSVASSSAYKLLDSTAKSAYEPDVVTRKSGTTAKSGRSRFTHNPLHSKLPRP